MNEEKRLEREIRFIDLFAGIGGFRRGLEKANDPVSRRQGQPGYFDKGRGVHSPSESDERQRTIRDRDPERANSSLGAKFAAGKGRHQDKEGLSADSGGEYGNGRRKHTDDRDKFVCVWSCDNNKYANQVYTKQFGEENHYSGDIRGVDPKEIPDFDLLCAGFPCQSFSVAGKGKGFQDTRGSLFFEISRIAEAKRPKMLLLENVKGLLSNDRGQTFQTILQELGRIGYWAEWQVFNSKHHGVPQNRERVFIIGHLRGAGGSPVFPITESHRVPTEGRRERKIKNQLSTAITQNLKRGVHSGGETLIVEAELKKIGNIAESGHDSIWGRVYDPEGIASNLNAEGGGLGAKTGLYAIPVLTPDRPNKRQHGRRFKEPGEPSFTLTGQDVYGVEVPDIANAVDADGYLRFGQRIEGQVLPIGHRRIRRLTPTECERLQGFPDGWTEGISDTQRYKCLGNAVTVNVIEFLGHKLRESINSKSLRTNS